MLMILNERFKSKEQSRGFQRILNKQDKHIQFTIDDENKEKCLNFLDIKIKNNNGRYKFDVHGKLALTNVHIKLHSCISPSTITSIFTGFLARATKSVLCQNGHGRITLRKIMINFEEKTRSVNDDDDDDDDNNNNKNSSKNNNNSCSKLAQKEYKRRHDNQEKIVHSKLARKCNFEAGDK